MGLIDDRERARLDLAERRAARTPVPTQIVASDEYSPDPQNAAQCEVERRLTAQADAIAPRLGLSRRRFFQTAAGMTAAFVAMNDVYGAVFDADAADVADPDRADARAHSLRGQAIVDGHTHFLRDDTRLTQFVSIREDAAEQGWNPALVGKPQTIEHLKYDNYFKEMYLDSDTKVALISSAPSVETRDWFLTNAQMIAARERVNREAGSRRMLAHAIFTPGAPGWLEQLDEALAAKPDSMKGYTIGDNTHKDKSHWPWRMDDEKTTYRGYEKMLAAGVDIVCVHKGLFPRALDRRFPNLRGYVDVSDVAQAAKDWPKIRFVIYHAGYRHVGADPAFALAEFERTGRSEWVTDLAEIPQLHGVDNVYADIGQTFAVTVVSQPKLAAGILGTLIKGMGADHVCWGTDAVWTGSPQWQIEGLRRMEIPAAMQRSHGYAALGAADGDVKQAIFSRNSARLYGLGDVVTAVRDDAFSRARDAYESAGAARSNRRYGYVARGSA
jgi:uncharacterized protein